MIKNKIISNNKRLGLNAVFFYDENGVLGYAEDTTVYLNEFYKNDLELINKHEILHFYESSKQFKGIKKIVLSLMDKATLNEIREYYLLKYSGLYSDSEIKNGAIDNEIIIDMIVGNGKFPININEIIKNPFETIINNEKSVKLNNKKYLNLNISNKVKQQFMELTKWEKIFVMNFYENRDNLLPLNKATRYKDIRQEIETNLEKLYKIAEEPSYFNIRVDSEELLREYEIEIRKLYNAGELDKASYLKEHKKEALVDLSKKYSTALYYEYVNIVSLIRKTNYEPAFKYLMLNETLTKTYRQQKTKSDINNLVGKREKGITIKSHMTFNETVLGVIYNNLEDYSNFANLYFAGVSMLSKNVSEKNRITLNGVSTFNKGKWIRFESKKTKPYTYIKIAQELAAMVNDTPWCTKQQASLHLEEGDFYLFVDHDDKPHLGVKLIGDRIDEVRGVANGNAQEIEEEYRDVALEFLMKNKNIKFGKEWLEKEEWNKRLVDYAKKIESKTLTKDDITNLVYDLTEISDYKAHYAQCGNRLKLIELIKDNKAIRKAVAKKYGCSPKKVCLGNVSAKDIRDCKFPYEVVLGNVSFFNYDGPKRDLSKLKVVLGNLDVSRSNIDNLDSLTVVGGNAGFSSTEIEHIDNLKTIGEIGDFYDAKIKSLSSLEKIGGTASFMFADIDDLSSLKVIGEDAHFESCKIKCLCSLETVYGNCIFNGATIGEIGAFNCIGKVGGFYDVLGEEQVETRRSRR